MGHYEEISHAVLERLEFIELQLRFKGWVSRADLMSHFGVAEAAVTRDFKKYKEISNENMFLDHTYKRYAINKSGFKPVFNKTLDGYLAYIKSKGNPFGGELPIIESMEKISGTNLDVFSMLSVAINNSKTIKIKYRSLDNGLSEKYITPHSFFDTDIRMYVRCYDREKGKFLSLLVNRVVSVSDDDVIKIEKDKDSLGDELWNSFVELILVPHPNQNNVKNKECVEMDLGMSNGCKVIKVRCATGAFWLNRWNVDCSKNATMDGKKYQLFLKNREALDVLDSALIVNGFNE